MKGLLGKCLLDNIIFIYAWVMLDIPLMSVKVNVNKLNVINKLII